MGIRIDDLTEPRLPLGVRALNAGVGRLDRSLFRIDEESLLTRAERRTRLYDFGDDGFREPLHVLVRALEGEGNLTPLGRLKTRQLLLQLLTTRLRVQDLVTRHPEIVAAEVPAPIVIVGLPRSGLAHVHSLLACDPSLRSLPYWESQAPLPDDLERAPRDPDPRIARSERDLRAQHKLSPLLPLMRSLSTGDSQEELHLQAGEFRTMLFESLYAVPSYGDWYRSNDQTPGYRYLKRMLQVLQWLRGPRAWVLGSAQHLEQIGPLLRVFPDARIVQMHRDPVRVTASLCTQVAYSMRGKTDPIDSRAIGRYWFGRVEDLLRASVEDRSRIPHDQILDLHYHDVQQDELGSIARVYEFVARPLSEDALDRMRAYRDTHRHGRRASIDYDLEDFALDGFQVRQALGFYQRRFGVPDE